MLTWFLFAIVAMLWSCIIKLLARFSRIKLHDGGFDFISSFFYMCRFSNPMDTINMFILELMIHFVAFFYSLQDIIISFIITTFESMNLLAVASVILFIIIIFDNELVNCTCFDGNFSLKFINFPSDFSSYLEIISSFNFLNMSSKTSLVANRLTTSEKYSRISCDTEIFVVFADDGVTTKCMV